MSILVVFFGGFRASQTDMELWLASAKKKHSDVRFEAFPYPDGAGPDRDDAVNGFSKQFDAVVKTIEDSGADTIFIVGHSSGCAIADEVNSRVEGDHKNIILVDLDGFAPLHKQIKGATVQAWSAVGTDPEDHSLNWAKGNIMFTSAHATQPWSLHFSLVNSAATDAINKHNYKTKGYAGCIANLRFLENFLQKQKTP